MIHEMKLKNAPFQAIQSGKKTIEMRLYDEKRRKLRVGDQIRFRNTENGETLLCKIIALHCYPTFTELYNHHDKISIGYMENEPALPTDMSAYYADEEIEKFGVVGVEISLISEK